MFISSGPLTRTHGRTIENRIDWTDRLAGSPEVAGVSGRYFEDKRAVRSSALSYDRRVQDRLWNIAENLRGIKGEGNLPK